MVVFAPDGGWLDSAAAVREWWAAKGGTEATVPRSRRDIFAHGGTVPLAPPPITVPVGRL